MSNMFSRPAPAPTQTIMHEAPAAPTPAAPPTMPDTISPENMAARRRVQQEVMGRAGRSSTILSSAMGRTGVPAGKTGTGGAPNAGGAYASTKLGTGV